MAAPSPRDRKHSGKQPQPQLRGCPTGYLRRFRNGTSHSPQLCMLSRKQSRGRWRPRCYARRFGSLHACIHRADRPCDQRLSDEERHQHRSGEYACNCHHSCEFHCLVLRSAEVVIHHVSTAPAATAAGSATAASPRCSLPQRLRLHCSQLRSSLKLLRSLLLHSQSAPRRRSIPIRDQQWRESRLDLQPAHL